jgi:LAO/AO transport system kinase
VSDDGLDGLLARVLDGDHRALARVLTVVESGDEDQLRTVTAALHPHAGRARVIGLTGPPGVGKSTLGNALTGALRAQGRTVGVVAVDPSSPVTGGALLGDRIRMQAHHADPGVFVRSSASRGHLGGVAATTPHAVTALDAAGFDVVLLETVGVGQSEVEVAATADTTVVVLAPGFGDGVQAAKAGLLEVADVLVVNQADREGAGALATTLAGMRDLGVPPDGWRAPIVRTVAVRGEGVDGLAEACEQHRAFLESTGALAERRRRRAAQAIRGIVLERLGRAMVAPEVDVASALPQRVADRQIDPFTAADELLGALGADVRPVRPTRRADR